MKKVPQRKCVGCREMFDKSVLIRVSKNTDGTGRGAYVCENNSCIAKARKAKGFERSLKRAIPQQLYDCLLSNPKYAWGFTSDRE